MIFTALLNNIYVFVEEESINYSGASTTHPVESGLPISDHFQREPIELSLSGKIVDSGAKNAKDILGKLRQLQCAGSLINYVGKNSLGNLQIQDISVSSVNTNFGGYNVEITLKEIRIANSAYDAAKSAALAKKKQTSSQQISQGNNSKVYHTVAKGQCVWNLVSKQYKNLKPSYSSVQKKCNWVMDQNPSAFSRKGDFRTLQTGKRLYIGYR